MGTKIFLSHSAKDKQFVRRLAIDLEQNGIDTWFDEWELQVGDSLISKIQEGVSESDYILVVLSPDSVSSKWVQEEIKPAILDGIEGSKTSLLPLLYKDCEIQPFLRDKVYADFRSDYTAGLHMLIRRIKSENSNLQKEIAKNLNPCSRSTKPL